MVDSSLLLPSGRLISHNRRTRSLFNHFTINPENQFFVLIRTNHTHNERHWNNRQNFAKREGRWALLGASRSSERCVPYDGDQQTGTERASLHTRSTTHTHTQRTFCCVRGRGRRQTLAFPSNAEREREREASILLRKYGAGQVCCCCFFFVRGRLTQNPINCE